MREAHLIYVTCPDLAVATRIAEDLVQGGLAACANAIPGVRSVYRWQGAVERGEEVILLVKTGTHEAAVARIAALHPYSLPAIVCMPLTMGSQGFLGWVAANGAADRV